MIPFSTRASCKFLVISLLNTRQYYVSATWNPNAHHQGTPYYNQYGAPIAEGSHENSMQNGMSSGPIISYGNYIHSGPQDYPQPVQNTLNNPMQTFVYQQGSTAAGHSFPFGEFRQQGDVAPRPGTPYGGHVQNGTRSYPQPVSNIINNPGPVSPYPQGVGVPPSYVMPTAAPQPTHQVLTSSPSYSPIIDSTEITLSPGFSKYLSDSSAQSSPNVGISVEPNRKRKLDKYFGAKKVAELEKRAKPREHEASNFEAEKRTRSQFTPSFDTLLRVCAKGSTGTLVQKPDFYCGYTIYDYLALAIKCKDVSAMKYASSSIHFDDEAGDDESSGKVIGPFLQRVLIDLIVCEDIETLKTLGEIFHRIYTCLICFDGSYKNLQNSSLLRFALDNKKPFAFTVMFWQAPESLIEEFWNVSDESRSYFIENIGNGILTLPKGSGISKTVINDMFYMSVSLNNVAAVKNLVHSGLVNLDDNFFDPENMEFSPLYLAAHLHYVDVCKYLGEIKPDLYKKRTSTGMLPAHVAALNGTIEILKLMSEIEECFESTVQYRGADLTPFALAMRNGQTAAAEYILQVLLEQKSGDPKLRDSRLHKEFLNLASWAIIEDNPNWLKFVLEGKHFPEDGRFPGSEFSLLEMVVRGTVDSSVEPSRHCSVKCLEYLANEWKIRGLSTQTFSLTLGVRGSILSLVQSNDINAFAILVEKLEIPPNEPIYVFTPNFYKSKEDAIPESFRTTFLHRCIELKYDDAILEMAIQKGADPRAVSYSGCNALETAKIHQNFNGIKLISTYEGE